MQLFVVRQLLKKYHEYFPILDFGVSVSNEIALWWLVKDTAMWLTLVLLAIFFYQCRLSPSWILSQRIYRSNWTQANLRSSFYIDPRAHYPRWVLTGHNWCDIHKFFVFFFPPSLFILSIAQLKSPSIILLSFSFFLFSV